MGEGSGGGKPAAGGVVAVIPIKPLNLAKSRLAPHLTDIARRRLAVNMLARVITAARGAVDEVWVLGSDNASAGVAQAHGAVWRREQGLDVNESLRLVFNEVWQSGRAALFLPGDLPFVTAQDIEGLAAAALNGPGLALSPARRGSGTNAIVINRPMDFRFQLGPDSFPRHVEEARRCGVEPVVHATDGLAKDLDTWEDVREYRATDPYFLARLTQEEQ